jgi:RHS repeat-associated protein
MDQMRIAASPSIPDRGFTGHRQNTTGTYDLGLIYMNARYYVPEVGRFVSPNTLVPTLLGIPPRLPSNWQIVASS